jgi:biotin operon repressor
MNLDQASAMASDDRGHGWSWQQIGDALGMTRQSIHTKYGR